MATHTHFSVDMNFLNLNIANRLRLGFGLQLIFILVLAIVGVKSVDKLHDGTDELAKRASTRVRLANLALDNVRGSMGRVGQLVAVTDPAARDAANARLAANMAEADKALKELEPLLVAPTGKILLAESVTLRSDYMALVGQVQTLAKEEKLDEARALAFGKTYDALHALAANTRKQLEFQSKRFDELAVEASNTYTTALRIIAIVAAVAMLLAIGAALWITRSVVRPLSRAVEVARTVAAGDLTSHIEVEGSDEAAQMMLALRDMNASLANLVSEVRTGSDEIATAANEIASGNLELSSRTEQQAGSLEETASSMEEMTSTVRQNAENALQANQLAASASDVARRGGEVVARVVETMGDIDVASRKIVEIIAVIDGIAFQTNILALNAAVEAARAGEQGRGFAVVASEVRNLAQRSASAAREIKQLIDDSVGKVSQGTQLVGQAGATMGEVVDSVQRVTDIMAEISSASREQEGGITQINHAITEMDAVTQQNAALVEEAAGAAGSLQEQAERLAQMVAVFRVEMGSATPRKVVSKAAPEQRLPAVVAKPKVAKRGAALEEWETF
ncbi:methyl-accepting chemotaxis protein [Massilia aerilata]|uniref:Methyl-accepting chemotaxis protein n=1 Tax=Massilia aerilata TaxID=453817 RepID=A0ABW0RY32_9BURK